MQQFKIPENLTASYHRIGFMRDIRNIRRQEIKKRARSQIVRYSANQDISYLMRAQQNHISNQDLEQLVKYANQHYHKTVAHIGNLVIDGVVKISQLQKFTFVPDYHPYWLWLTQVLVERSYCTIGLFQHCIKTIGPSRLEKSVKHALSILYKITSCSMYSSFMMRQQDVLLAIVNATFRKDTASRVAYLLLNELIIKQEGMTERFKEGILRGRLFQSLKNGLLSTVSIIRRYCIKILKEMVVKRVQVDQLNSQLIRFMKSENFIEHSELFLEYVMQFVLSASIQAILAMIDLGLLVQLGRWKRNFEKDERLETGLIIKICRQIKNFTSDLGIISKGISLELERLNLISFSTVQYC